jgi:hypothetical protein
MMNRGALLSQIPRYWVCHRQANRACTRINVQALLLHFSRHSRNHRRTLTTSSSHFRSQLICHWMTRIIPRQIRVRPRSEPRRRDATQASHKDVGVITLHLQLWLEQMQRKQQRLLQVTIGLRHQRVLARRPHWHQGQKHRLCQAVRTVGAPALLQQGHAAQRAAAAGLLFVVGSRSAQILPVAVVAAALILVLAEQMTRIQCGCLPPRQSWCSHRDHLIIRLKIDLNGSQQNGMYVFEVSIWLPLQYPPQGKLNAQLYPRSMFAAPSWLPPLASNACSTLGLSKPIDISSPTATPYFASGCCSPIDSARARAS